MKIRLVTYNMKWMKDLFLKDGTPRDAQNTDTSKKELKALVDQSAALASVVKAINPDVLCVVEGPDTLKSGAKTASGQLEAWAQLHGLNPNYKGVHGFPSGGQQELCALYRSTKVTCTHAPETKASRNPFNNVFYVDTTDSLVKERYKHYRPPFEMSIKNQAGTKELMRVIVAHTKSKGIFDSVDLARFEQLSERNRRKLFAECYSIRERCNQWLKDDPKMKIAVVGDVNDGFGLDYYEQRFSRSAVETLLGDVWDPTKILLHVLPRPKLGKYGWEPSSSSFRDKLTEDRVNVLIDHILVTPNVKVENPKVWNPWPKNAPADVKAIGAALKKASDHFPVSADVTI